MRQLPEQITETNCQTYQVRIVRDGFEYSASFSWSIYGSKEIALQEAVVWRDKLLAKLPPAGNGRGSFRREPMAHKRSHGRVGITRYIKRDYRRVGTPEYLVFGVNWTDSEGARVTQFQAGRLGAMDWKDELHAALTAEAFRTEWEFCRASNLSFASERYRQWSEFVLYPFEPPESLHPGCVKAL